MILAGDFVPQKTIPEIPDFGDEIVLANLEGPLCEDGLKPIDKVGIHLHSSPRQISGRWAFTLANNHLMDYREEGLRRTLEVLDDQAIPHGGAGLTLGKARQVMWLKDSGKQIAVVCCCEHQFGVASDCHGGVAAVGAWVIPAIVGAKQRGADFVVVSCHMGSESSKFVSPRQVALYHSFIDAGADVIHGHHAHVPQGWEEYKGHPIFYGLGNFVVDKQSWSHDENFRWSLVVKVDFAKSKPSWCVLRVGELPERVEEYLDEANSIFSDPVELRRRWGENARVQYERYYKPFLRFGVYSLLFRMLHPIRYRLLMTSFKTCETHCDIIETALEK